MAAWKRKAKDPDAPRCKPVSLSVTDADLKAWDAEAQRLNVSRSGLVRRAVRMMRRWLNTSGRA